ncbi:F169A protein, partial [Upupa epops]|nr:F169A protein [Upupa epops]
AVALYLANRWWSIDEILRTSAHDRQGLHQVQTLGERIVLYVLNRIIYRTQEMETNEAPFLCHGINTYAKILWKRGEAIGFYSVKPKGSTSSSFYNHKYKMTVLDTMFIRKKHRDRNTALIILEDFVDSFPENTLGIQYPLSRLMYTGKLQFLEKYPDKNNLLWQVEGVGNWYQRKAITVVCQQDEQKTTGTSLEENVQEEDRSLQSVVAPEASARDTDLGTMQSVVLILENSTIGPVSIWKRSHLKRPRIGRITYELQTDTSQDAFCVSESRKDSSAHTSESSEDLVEVPEETPVVEETVADKSQSVSEVELHVSPSEKQSEEGTPSEALNGGVTEETSKTSLMAEEETANEVLSGESKLQSEHQEEPVMLFVPLILESQAKPAEDSVSEKVLNANDSDVRIDESLLVEKESSQNQQESEKINTGNTAVSASKEGESSDSGLPSSVVTEAAEESILENVSPKTTSSREDQNEESGHNSQEAPVAMGQSNLIMVEIESVSLQQSSGQEAQKNQLEEHSEESAELGDQYTQTATERAADSSSEEVEMEVPVVDRRNLRRKAKGHKGPPKKKGKMA